MTFLLWPHSQRWVAAFSAALVVAAIWHSAAAQEPAKNWVIHDAPKPLAAIQFRDDQGQSRSLADFRGKVVLLNIWATWCVPCRKEMPALDRLNAALGGPDFEVTTLSIDRAIDAVRKFFADVARGAAYRPLLSRQSVGAFSAGRRRPLGRHRAQLELAGCRRHRAYSYKRLAVPGDVRAWCVHAVPFRSEE